MCPTTCGIFPDQGSNPCPLHWQAHSKLVDDQGSPMCSARSKTELMKWALSSCTWMVERAPGFLAQAWFWITALFPVNCMIKGQSHSWKFLASFICQVGIGTCTLPNISEVFGVGHKEWLLLSQHIRRDKTAPSGGPTWKILEAWILAWMCAKSLQSCLTLWPSRHLCPWDSPGKYIGMGCLALLQGSFPIQWSNPCLFQLPALAGRFFTTSATWEVSAWISVF